MKNIIRVRSYRFVLICTHVSAPLWLHRSEHIIGELYRWRWQHHGFDSFLAALMYSTFVITLVYSSCYWSLRGSFGWTRRLLCCFWRRCSLLVFSCVDADIWYQVTCEMCHTAAWLHVPPFFPVTIRTLKSHLIIVLLCLDRRRVVAL